VNVSSPFPVTLIQEQVMQDMERFAANITTTGLSPRVNNIVRAFNIHGPLDKELLKEALDKIVNFQPLLSSTFLRSKGQLFAQTPSPGILTEISPQDFSIIEKLDIQTCSSKLKRLELIPRQRQNLKG
jgi:hypothetical protein